MPVKKAKKWPDTPYDPLLGIDHFPGNYGVVLKADDLILDVDPRNFKEGDNPLKRLLSDAGMAAKPKTLIIKSGNKGYHIYLKKPPGFPHRTKDKEYQGIDFKTQGQFLVGPGSIHPDTGNTYKLMQGDPAGILDAPENLLALLQQEKTVDTNFLNQESDDEGASLRFIAYLKGAPLAIQHCNGDNTTYMTAAVGRDFGLSSEITYELMMAHWNFRCSPPWSPDELRGKVKNAYSYAKGGLGSAHPALAFADIDGDTPKALDTIRSREEKYYKWSLEKDGKPKPNNIGNMVNYFLTPSFESFVNPLYRLFRYNEFAGQIEFSFPAPWHTPDTPVKLWTDTDAVQMKYWFSQEKNYETNVALCHEAVTALATTFYRYHPVKEYLEALEWDGVPRLDRLLCGYAGAEPNKYTTAVGKNTLIAAVARVYTPGCQFDHILILEGDQGTGKSTFVRVLGGEWYRDIIIDPHNKDTVDAMRGAWLLEASEMEFTRRADIQSLKAFITRVNDFMRPAYGRVTQSFPRQCVTIGTINPDAGKEYLRDTTGNRRFWPVRTGKIKMEKLIKDRDQIWAEALHRYRAGEIYYLSDSELIRLAEEEQKGRMVQDMWVEIIESWLDAENPESPTTTEIAYNALNLTARQIDRVSQVRIAQAMMSLGWEKGKFYIPSLKQTKNAFRRIVDLEI